MPTYEYLCKACEHEFEREQRISDPPVKTCPRCKARQVKRLISATRFHLKGGGWYSDLYSSAGAKKAGKKEAGEGKSEKAASPAKSEGGSGSAGSGGSGSGDSSSGGSGSKAAA